MHLLISEPLAVVPSYPPRSKISLILACKILRNDIVKYLKVCFVAACNVIFYYIQIINVIGNSYHTFLKLFFLVVGDVEMSTV